MQKEERARAMDEMKINSKFLTGIVSKIIDNLVKKKLGVDVAVQVNSVQAAMQEGNTHLHLDVDADLRKEDLERLLKKLGVL
jgi:hypothetical protein